MKKHLLPVFGGNTTAVDCLLVEPNACIAAGVAMVTVDAGVWVISPLAPVFGADPKRFLRAGLGGGTRPFCGMEITGELCTPDNKQTFLLNLSKNVWRKLMLQIISSLNLPSLLTRTGVGDIKIRGVIIPLSEETSWQRGTPWFDMEVYIGEPDFQLKLSNICSSI